jgi:N-acetylmuramoyl-L-alanine amidase
MLSACALRIHYTYYRYDLCAKETGNIVNWGKISGRAGVLFACFVFAACGSSSLARPDTGPASSARSLRGYTIALAAGHTRATNALVPYNGDGVGTFSADGDRIFRYPGNALAIKSGEWEGVIRESDFNEDIVARTTRHLAAHGARVNKVRVPSKDATPSGRRKNMHARVHRANRSRAALLLDIHANSGPSGARGFMIFIPSSKEQLTNFRPGRNFIPFNKKIHAPFDDWRQERSLELAELINKALTNRARGQNPIPPFRGGAVNISRFFVINRASMPAVLVEFGYMSSQADMNHLACADYRENMAERLTDAIREYVATGPPAHPRLPRSTPHAVPLRSQGGTRSAPRR